MYWNRMFLMVSRKVKDREDVLDIIQNIFLHLWLYRQSLTKENAESIIIKPCIQEISNFYSIQKKKPLASNIEETQLSDDANERLQTIMDKEEQLEHLRINMELLPTLRKKILQMNKIEGIPQERIASNFNLSTKAVKKQIAKAIIFLRYQQNNS